jgi:chaperonin GroES
MQNSSGVIPLDMRVVVKPDDAETVTKGGIIIPDTVAERKGMAGVNGVLIAAGDNAWEEAKNRAPGFVAPKVGERIMFAKYGGVEFKRGDEMFRIMNDEDIIGRLED